jgi:hypothetical protein
MNAKAASNGGLSAFDILVPFESKIRWTFPALP